MAEHHLDDSVTLPAWDRAATPRLVVQSGDVVHLTCPEPCGQVTPHWQSADLVERWNKDLVHALIGPVHVDGCAPGEVLEIEVIELKHHGWGWSGHLPGFGLLADEFDFPYLHHWQLEGEQCRFGKADIVVPAAPFCGCMGVAPQGDERLDTIPPRRNGGNVDIRDLVAGSTVWLPVFAEGALFSCGDGHMSQGHGEVSGTGIETPMDVTVRLTRRPETHIEQLRYRTPAATHPLERGPRHVTTAAGGDLLEISRDAVRQMLDWLTAAHRLTRSEALVLCGAAADLKINEIVNLPNYVVSCSMPLGVFASD